MDLTLVRISRFSRKAPWWQSTHNDGDVSQQTADAPLCSFFNNHGSRSTQCSETITMKTRRRTRSHFVTSCFTVNACSIGGYHEPMVACWHTCRRNKHQMSTCGWPSILQKFRSFYESQWSNSIRKQVVSRVHTDFVVDRSTIHFIPPWLAPTKKEENQRDMTSSTLLQGTGRPSLPNCNQLRTWC